MTERIRELLEEALSRLDELEADVSFLQDDLRDAEKLVVLYGEMLWGVVDERD